MSTLPDPVLEPIFQALGIPLSYPKDRGLPFHQEISLEKLRVVEIDFEGKPLILSEPAAAAWVTMKAAAAIDGVDLLTFSGFRSYRYQEHLIRRRLRGGTALQDVLSYLTAPGYSEHHTGRAVDLTASGTEPGTEQFATSDAFGWLDKRGSEFGYSMTYPENNPFGILYEPWHWAYRDCTRSEA